jgi:hypothetical protein
MTCEKKRDLREEAALLRQHVARWRAEREILKREFDRAMADLRKVASRF